MIMAVFVRRLKEGRTFEEFIAEWEADEGFGFRTRVFNAPSLEDPRDIVSVGFVDLTAAEFAEWAQQEHPTETVRHDRIESVIESTTLRCQYDVRTEHDFTDVPISIDIGSPASLLAGLVGSTRADR